ncbi:MAG: hypothetical protein DMG94_11645, partial [Acidobacteria bacterium]
MRPVQPATAIADPSSDFLQIVCNGFTVSFLILLGLGAVHAQVPPQNNSLQLIRPAHTWEFLDAVGMSAGLFGAQDGRFEAWVYPLKLLRDFHLVFTADGREFPAESLARSVTARPECVIITYSADNFTVNETWFVPVDSAGAVVQLDIETWTPLQIEARFRPDMQMMWPAVLGSTSQKWDSTLHVFTFSDATDRYYGLVGGPEVEVATPQNEAKDSGTEETTLQLPTVPIGRNAKLIVIASSVTGREEAEAVYSRLSSGFASLLDSSAVHYQEFLSRTTSIEVPDSEIQQAYD